MKKNIFMVLAIMLEVSVLAQGPGGGPGGGGNQPGGGGNQPGGGGSASFTFDTFLAATTTASGCILREGVWTGFSSPVSVTLTSAVTNIAAGVCAGCTTLTSLNLSATHITAVPDSAFAGCTALTTVVLPASCTNIGANAFADCTALAAVTGSGVIAVGADAFRGCEKLTALPTFSSAVICGAYAFAGSGIKSADVSSVTLSEGTFAGCKALTSLTGVPDALPDALCSGCTVLSFDPSSCSSFGRAALAGVPYTTLTFASSDVTLGKYAFAAEEATVVTVVEMVTPPAYKSTTFLGRLVSYTPSDGVLTRIEAKSLVTWLKAQAEDSASTVKQPASYATSDLEVWLEDHSNANAIMDFCYEKEFAADADFYPLTVYGTTFYFMPSDKDTNDSVIVTPIGSTELEGVYEAGNLTELETDDDTGITSYESTVATGVFFVKLNFAKGW